MFVNVGKVETYTDTHTQKVAAQVVFPIRFFQKLPFKKFHLYIYWKRSGHVLFRIFLYFFVVCSFRFLPIRVLSPSLFLYFASILPLVTKGIHTRFLFLQMTRDFDDDDLDSYLEGSVWSEKPSASEIFSNRPGDVISVFPRASHSNMIYGYPSNYKETVFPTQRGSSDPCYDDYYTKVRICRIHISNLHSLE